MVTRVNAAFRRDVSFISVDVDRARSTVAAASGDSIFGGLFFGDHCPPIDLPAFLAPDCRVATVERSQLALGLVIRGTAKNS